jgi:arylsulfatase A-like enzyme
MKPNIILILIDSFNAEKFFGSTKTSITPNIDYLIKNGTYFSKAITVAPTTIPAISSIFTGLYPFQSVKKIGKILKINDEIDNYIKRLRDFGYTTHAIVPKIVSLVNLNSLFFNNIEVFDSFATLYDGVEEQILKKIDSNQKEPWFCYIHLMDIHGDATFHLKEGPKQYDDIKFGNNRYERMVSSMDIKLKKIVDKINLDNTIVVVTADHGSFTANYDHAMELQNDISNKKRDSTENETKESNLFKIGHKIFTNLPDKFNPIRKSIAGKYIEKRNEKIESDIKSQLNQTNFSGLSIYKKRLLENSIAGNAKLFDDICRVPLLFSGYNIPKKIISEQVRNMDIFPTIFNLIGLENSMNKSNQSLEPLMKGKEIEKLDAFIYSVTNSSDEVFIGIRTEDHKYFRKITDDIENASLFNLKDDPREEINLIKNEKNIAIELEQKIEKILNSNKKTDTDSNERDSNERKEVEAELKKLGYI